MSSILIPNGDQIPIADIIHISLWDSRRGDRNQAMPDTVKVPTDVNHEYALLIFIRDGSRIDIIAEDCTDIVNEKRGLFASEKRNILNKVYLDLISQMSNRGL